LPWCAGVPVRRACRTGTVPLTVELIAGHGVGDGRLWFWPVQARRRATLLQLPLTCPGSALAWLRGRMKPQPALE
jgi:hypothetical protein